MSESSNRDPSRSSSQPVQALLETFAQAWHERRPQTIEQVLEGQPAERLSELFPRLLELELSLRRSAGEKPLPEEYLRRFAPRAAEVERAFGTLASGGETGPGESASQHKPEEVTEDYRRTPTADSLQTWEGEHLPPPPTPPTEPAGEDSPGLQSIGRFRVVGRLGSGGFGDVYLAHDPQLERQVAIKVPHARALDQLPSDWIREARIVAQLDHPHIVPVLEVGSSSEVPAFIVTKFIDGCSLAERLKQSPLPLVQIIDLSIAVAEALDYAHHSRSEIIHRDIKPANLLLDREGRVYVADFGLATREVDLEEHSGLSGTPPYMSPEQIRGEGHRMDGRSDVFSLGVVLYELLTGRRPFRGQALFELRQQITEMDPEPPRQLNPDVSPELERICLKALAKRASDRYGLARELANDLRQLRAGEWGLGLTGPASALVTPLTPQTVTPPSPGSSTLSSAERSGLSSRSSGQSASSARSAAIVSKGLRSFDAQDRDFFLDLVPGIRDREGLPESIRFWKQRIEAPDDQQPLQVGLLCGPSGCGKSSLVKAGLLPRLADRILPIYLEASPGDTESQLLSRLKSRLTRLRRKTDLGSALKAVRQGQAGLGSRKLLLVIDQFEQWLLAHQGSENAPLAQALRQCDGEHLQSLLLVRDDYALSVYRLLRVLEIPLHEGVNNAVVDRFDLDHARQVLTAFGRAFGRLPAEPAELSPDQAQFVRRAVESIAEQRLVVPVRLALFAEMFKNRPWTPTELVEVGGAEGVGRAFLEETFHSDKSPPQYRIHARAAEQMLAALLPEVGSDLKGHRRSRVELIAAAGYGNRPREAAELLRILDADLRLITPVEVQGGELEEVSTEPQSDGLATPPAASEVSSRAARSSPSSATPSTTAPLLAESSRTQPGADPLQSGRGLSAAGQPDGSALSEPTAQYHLTHDYLVSSLRRWIEDRLGGTPEGRAKLLLRERSRLWNDRPLNRHLPGWAEHWRIRRRTLAGERTAAEQKMLSRAAEVHGRQIAWTLLGTVATVLFLGGIAVERYQSRQRLSAAKALAAQAEIRQLKSDAQAQAAEGKAREELTLRQAAQREQSLTEQNRALAEAQRRLAFSEVARVQRIDSVAITGELAALNLLGGEEQQRSLHRLQAATNRTLTVAEQTPRRVRSARLAVAGQGRFYVTTDLITAQVRVWDAQTGEQLASLDQHREIPVKSRGLAIGSINGVAPLGPMDDRLITVGIDGQVVVWNLESFTAERSVELATDLKPRWTALAVSGEGVPRLADNPVVGSVSGALVWFDPETLEERQRVPDAHTRAVRAITQSSQGLLASGSMDGSVRLWSREGEPVATLRTSGGPAIRCLAFTPDGTRLLVGGEQEQIEFWDVGTRQLVQTAPAHELFDGQQVTTSVISVGPQEFLTSGTDGRVIRWDAETGRRRGEFRFQSEVTSRPNAVREVLLDPSRQRLVMLGVDDALRIADAQTGTLLAQTTGNVVRTSQSLVELDCQVAVARDGSAVVTSAETGDGSLQIWQMSDLSQCRFLTRLPELQDPQDAEYWLPPSATAVLPGAERIAVGTASGTVVLRSGEGAEIWKKDLGVTIHGLQFDQAAERLVVLNSQGQVRILSTAEGADLVSIDTAQSQEASRAELSSVLSSRKPQTDHGVLFLPGNQLATAGAAGVRVWSAETGELVRSLGTTGNPIMSLALGDNPAEPTLIGGDMWGTIYEWELASGRELSRVVVAPASATMFTTVIGSDGLDKDNPDLARSVLGLVSVALPVLDKATANNWGARASRAAWIATLGDGTLVIVDRNSGQLIARGVHRDTQLVGFRRMGAWNCTVFLDDQQRLCTASTDRAIRRWRMGLDRPGSAMIEATGGPGVLQMVPSQTHGWCVNLASQPSALALLSGDLLRPKWEPKLEAVKDLFWQMDELPDGRVVASRRIGSSLVWDPATGAQQECPMQSTSRHSPLIAAARHAALVATTLSPQKIALWDLPSNQVVAQLELPQVSDARIQAMIRQPEDRSLAALSFSPTGDLLVAATELGEIVAWDLVDGTPKFREVGQIRPGVSELCFSADGRRLFQGTPRDVVVWDPRKLGRPVGAFNWHLGCPGRLAAVNRGITSLDCSPDGSWLVTTCWDGTIAVGPAAETAASSPARVVLGLNDLLSVSGAPMANVSLVRQVMNSLDDQELKARFSHDGRQIAVAILAEGPARLVVLDLEEILQWAEGMDRPQRQTLQNWSGLSLTPDLKLKAQDRNRWVAPSATGAQ